MTLGNISVRHRRSISGAFVAEATRLLILIDALQNRPPRSPYNPRLSEQRKSLLLSRDLRCGVFPADVAGWDSLPRREPSPRGCRAPPPACFRPRRCELFSFGRRRAARRARASPDRGRFVAERRIRRRSGRQRQSGVHQRAHPLRAVRQHRPQGQRLVGQFVKTGQVVDRRRGRCGAPAAASSSAASGGSSASPPPPSGCAPCPAPPRGLPAADAASPGACRSTGNPCRACPPATAAPACARPPASARNTATPGSRPPARICAQPAGRRPPAPASPSPLVQERGTPRKKIRLHHQLADPRVQPLDQLLLVARRAAASRAVAEHLQQAVVGLRLPTAQLVRVDPVARGDRPAGPSRSARLKSQGPSGTG